MKAAFTYPGIPVYLAVSTDQMTVTITAKKPAKAIILLERRRQIEQMIVIAAASTQTNENHSFPKIGSYSYPLIHQTAIIAM